MDSSALGGRAAGLAALLLLGSCGGRGDERISAPPATSQTQWVSAFAVGEPDDLEDETATILEGAPRAIAVSPSGCWEGLAEALDAPADSYVAAVVGGSRAAVTDAARKVALPVLLTERFRAMCRQ